MPWSLSSSQVPGPVSGCTGSCDCDTAGGHQVGGSSTPCAWPGSLRPEEGDPQKGDPVGEICTCVVTMVHVAMVLLGWQGLCTQPDPQRLLS